MSLWAFLRTRNIIVLLVAIAMIENMILLVRIERQRYIKYKLMDVYQWRLQNSTHNVFPYAPDLVKNQLIPAEATEKMHGTQKPTTRIARETKKSTNNPTSANEKRKSRPVTISEDQYFRRKPSKVNPFNTNFLIINANICRPETEMVIIVHSLHQYQERRSAIRQTWGSIAKTSYNPKGQANISLAFSFGVHKEDRWNEVLINESEKYGDIIQGDFGEAYNNMTFKSLLEIKWVLEYCPKAKYLLKSDDDMFLNLPHLSNILTKLNMTRSIMGPYNLGSRVYRTGKWAIPENVYPFRTWPEYESGSAYVISADLLKDLFETSEYVPSIHIDDVYITGIVGKIVGARHVRVDGFAFWNSRRPVACDIINNKLVTGTKMTPSLLLSVWKDLKHKTKKQCMKVNYQL